MRSARQAVALTGPAVRIVHGLKYGGWSALAVPMGDRMAELRLPERTENDTRPHRRRVLVPVPTTKARARSRGYNQAALLAERVGQRLGLPVRHALERTSGSASQTRLRPDERAENVRGVFRCVRPGWVEGADVLLVDDVLTTGATAGEAAGVLSDAGAASVALIAFARALPDAA